jgi:programmed cell death 6-interacting protein
VAAGLLHQLGQLVSDAPWASEAASSGDFCAHSIDAMRTLMLAQAQRCFYEKAVLDGLSPKLLSLVASQAATYFGQAAAMLRADRMAARVDASWATVVEWNLGLFEGLAEFHAAEVHAAAYEYGLQVARLGVGVGKLKRAVALSSRAEPALRQVYEDTLAKLEWAYGLAVKDNTTVYCEPVPDAGSLPAVPGKSIVKPLPFEALDNTEGGTAGDDPFVRIVPVAIQHILDGYAAAARARIDALHARLEHVRACIAPRRVCAPL